MSKDTELIKQVYTSSSSYESVKTRINDFRFRINDVNTYNNNDLGNYIYKTRRGNKIDFWLSKEGILLLEGFSRDGKSIHLIAKEIGVSDSTLHDWKRAYPQINRALSQTREVVIRTLENVAMKSALGYTTSVIKPMAVKKAIRDDNDKIIGYEEVVEYVVEEEFIKPEWNMQQFLLKNIAPDKYKGDAKQIAEALNEEKLQQVLVMQQAFQKALLTTTSEDLINEEVVVITDDESNDNNSNSK